MGLSSSAALEVATGQLALTLHQAELAPSGWPRRPSGRRTSLGVACGIMDQFTATLGEAGHALLLDCRSLEYPGPPHSRNPYFLRCSPAPKGRTLAGSGYNRRRQECEAAAQLLAQAKPGVKALRDVTSDDLSFLEARVGESFRGHPVATLHRRARHVVEDTAGSWPWPEALEHGHLETVGRLVSESHQSLRDLFQVSTPTIDRWVEALIHLPGCLGARLVGGGFGGSILAVVRREAAGAFQDQAA